MNLDIATGNNLLLEDSSCKKLKLIVVAIQLAMMTVCSHLLGYLLLAVLLSEHVSSVVVSQRTSKMIIQMIAHCSAQHGKLLFSSSVLLAL